MMVMMRGATPVDRLTAVGTQYVDLSGLGQGLEGAVHRGQADTLAAVAQSLVDLLRGAETVGVIEQPGHCGPLPGGAQARGAHSSSTWVTASTTMRSEERRVGKEGRSGWEPEH